ncbi:fibronectin type III domain-containing protein, partial [Nocardioides humilatus]
MLSTTTTYRVLAPTTTIAGVSYPATYTPSKTVPTQLQSGTLTLADTTPQGSSVKATAVFKPARPGRPVQLQRRDGSNWTLVASGVQANNGSAALPVDTSVARSFTYRAVTTVYQGAAEVITPGKTITIVDTTAPPRPTDVVATPGDQTVRLTWSAVSATDLGGYHVYQATSGTGPWTKLTTTALTTRAYTVTGLTNRTKYWLAVTSIDKTGNESPRSPSATTTPADTTPPPRPTGLTATPGDTTAHLTWNPVTANDLAGYHVYQATTATGPWTKLTTTPVTPTSYDATGLINGTKYWF